MTTANITENKYSISVNKETNLITVTAPEALSFTQSGTGAATISVDSKIRQTIHIEDFGAVGDGSTDDTAAIQAAIDYAESLKASPTLTRGGTILIGAKKYKTTAPLIIDTGGITIQGTGTRFFSSTTPTSSIVGHHTNGPVIHVKASSTTLQGFSIRSDGDRKVTISATYGRSGTTVTITKTNHGLVSGNSIVADFADGGATDGTYTITKVDDNTFTLTDSASGTISAGTSLTYTDFSSPAIGAGLNRNDGIQCVAPNNGSSTSERINYVCIDDMLIKDQPASGIIICGNSVGCHIKNTICEFNNSHNIYIGRGDEAGYTHTGDNRVGILSITDCRLNDSGGNNLLVGDVIANNIYVPYRVRVVNNESFRSGHLAANRHDSLDFDVILIGENIFYGYSACAGRGTGGASDGNGLLVGGRNIVVDNNRFINAYLPIRVAQTNDADGSLSQTLGFSTRGVTINMPAVFLSGGGSVPVIVKFDSKSEFSSLNQAPENVKIYAPYLGGVTDPYDETVVINSGQIDYTIPVIRIDTEGSASSDDLDTINGTTIGDEVTLFQNNSARVVTINHGTGNIRLTDSETFTFDGVQTNITFLYDGTNWIEKTRTNVTNQVISPSEINMGDNNKIHLGNSNDIQFYFDGNNSVLDSNTGNFYIQTANNLFVQGANNENIIKYVANGSLEAYHDNVKKLETTSSGITVQGSVTTQDMNMSNLDGTANEVDSTKGSWSIQEGADDLFLINRVSGKKYKFNLTEIS